MPFRTAVLALVAALALVGPFGATAFAKRADPSCSISPNLTTVNQAYAVNAVGLPTVDPVWLIVTPPSGSGSVSQVTVGPDGTASVTTSGSIAGAWTYAFSGLQQNNKYGTVASCSVQVS